MGDPTVDADERDTYADRAIEVALRNIRAAFDERPLGEFEGWEKLVREDGVYLQISLVSTGHHGQRLKYARTVLPAHGPDKDPETAGMIFSAAFEERLQTRQPRPAEDSDGGYLVL